MSDLIAYGCNLHDRGLEPLLYIRRSAKAVTGILPNVRREEQGWELTKVEVVNNTQWLGTRGTRPERARKNLAVALGQRLLNAARSGLSVASSINFTDDSTQGAFGFHDALPHSLGPRQEPRRRKWRGVWLTPELTERNTNDVRHSSPPLTKEFRVIHRLPSQWKGVLSAYSAPSVVVDR